MLYHISVVAIVFESLLTLVVVVLRCDCFEMVEFVAVLVITMIVYAQVHSSAHRYLDG